MAPPPNRSLPQPYLIGLTGNIACGKSAVLALLAERGAATIDADRVVHALMEPGEAIWAAIREAFGPAISDAEGRIDRRALGAIVFNDPAQLARLERLTHPAVRAWIVARLAKLAREGYAVAVVDAIKLYEGGLAERCDETWVVTCDPAQQLARLMARNGFSEAEARQRIAAQPPQAEKIARADVIIDNSGACEATRAQVDAAWARLPLAVRGRASLPARCGSEEARMSVPTQWGTALERQVLWTPWTGPGLEHLRLTAAAAGVLADGLVIGVAEGQPFRAHYRVRCDAAWHVREVSVDPLDGRAPLVLRADGNGAWADGGGRPLPALAGCIDIDLSASPFTNTLPIRRLAWGEGEARVLTMAYIRVPELTVVPMRQRYTRLAADRYRYENVDSTFTAELPVDADGLVLAYPGIFRRV